MLKFSSISNHLLFWLTILLLAFIPLYPKFPLFNVRGTFVAVRIEDLLIILTVFLWTIRLLILGHVKNFFQDKLNQALLLFFSIGALSLFAGIFLTHTIVFPHLGVLHYLRRLEFMLLLPIVYSVVTTRKRVYISLATLSVTVLLVNLYGLGQQYLNWPVISTGNSEFAKGLILYLTPGARINSTFAGHYDLAVFLLMALVVLSGLFFGLKGWGVKVWSVFLIAFSFMMLVMTAARVSFVAALVGVITTLLLSGKRVFIGLLVILAVVALVYPSQLRDRFVSTVTVNLLGEWRQYIGRTEEQRKSAELNIPTLPVKVSSKSADWTKLGTSSGQVASDITPGEPVDTTQLGVYRSFSIRFNQEWPRALTAFYKNPLLGTGYSSLGIATDNDFLRSLGEVGILGTLAFALVLWEIFNRVRRNFQSNDAFVKYFSMGVFSMIIAFLLNGLFIDVFESSKIAALFWMILGLNLAAGRLR